MDSKVISKGGEPRSRSVRMGREEEEERIIGKGKENGGERAALLHAPVDRNDGKRRKRAP